MVSESPALLRSVVTHTIYNELSSVRSPNNMAVLVALIGAQPSAVPAAMADTYMVRYLYLFIQFSKNIIWA